MHPVVACVTEQIRQRSQERRASYLKNMAAMKTNPCQRRALHCGNIAHACAALPQDDKTAYTKDVVPNIAIVSAYNDMLSAHQPFQHYPHVIKHAVKKAGGVAQFAGGVPAMCDGITQGQNGMALSLLSRDVIAMSTAIALSHQVFDGMLLLGVCDKIVPGLLMGALRFGHLPCVLVPAGPMPSGLSNKEKSTIRKRYAQKEVSKEALLDAEMASYHSPGTCTFYGTANSNQLLMEAMGLHLPGASFVPPNTPLRQAFTEEASHTVVNWAKAGVLPLGELLDVKNLVNGIVAWLATGGSTNHTLHLPAIARAAGYTLLWEDLDALSRVTPLLAQIYPNGEEDINAFQQAGGMPLLIQTLLEGDLLHEDVQTVRGEGMYAYTQTPSLQQHALTWSCSPLRSSHARVIAPLSQPFQPNGGVSVLKGNVGKAILKTSALPSHIKPFKAKALVFHSQDAFKTAFEQGVLACDFIAVLRFQGPKASGMPELHQLTPFLSALQDKGYRVGLLTDGRMSGASGNIPAAIHLSPEAIDNTVFSRIQDGDVIVMDWEKGQLELLVDDACLMERPLAVAQEGEAPMGVGRELFTTLRTAFSPAEQGACSLHWDE